MQITPALAAIVGTALGAAYFSFSESSVPKDSNCSYLAPWTTDLAAWLAGAALLQRGWKLGDPLISFIGSLIISIHVGQFAAHKVIQNRIAQS
jgi:hypothetical protein